MFTKTLLLTFAASASAINVCIDAIAVFAFGALVVAGLAVVRAMAAKKSAAEPAAAADEPAAAML